MSDEVVPSPQVDVKAIIQNFEDQLHNDKMDIQNSRAMQAMESFSALSTNSFDLPFDLKIENISFYYANLRTQEGTNERGDFDYVNNLGNYYWDSGMGEFIKSSEETNYIQLNFPGDKNGWENNATLTITNYTEIDLTDIREGSSGPVFEVTSFESLLYIDGKVEMEIHYSAEYDNTGILDQMSLDAIINPFQLTIDLTQSNGVSQLNTLWEKQNNPILSSYFLIARRNVNFTAYEGLAFTGKTSGYIKYRELKVDGSFDFSNIEIENEDKSAACHMALYNSNMKLGKMYIDFETEGEMIKAGSIRYYIEVEDQPRFCIDGLIKPLFEGFYNLI